MNGKVELSGFILAGGKSKRMGTDKAFLLINGETLLMRTYNLIHPYCQTVAIGGQHPGFSIFNLPVFEDIYLDCGPIAGIHSGLLHSSTDWNLIVAVDLPFLNTDLIRYLVSNIGDFDCVIPKHDEGVEPLVGLYHKRILPEVEKMRQNGDYKLMNLLRNLNARYLDCTELVGKYPRLFANLNRPEDYNSI